MPVQAIFSGIYPAQILQVGCVVFFHWALLMETFARDPLLT